MTDTAQNPITEEAPQGADSEAEFGDAFDALAAEREGSPSKDAEPDDKAPSAPQAKNEAEPGSNEPRSGEGAAAKAPTSGNDDVFANAPEEVRSAVEALRNDYEHRLKSASGRLSAADRELAKLRQQQSSGGQEQEQRKPLKSLLEDDRLKTIGEEYPDLKPLLETLTSVAERVDHVGTTFETAQTTAAETAEEQALTERVPNWVDLARHEKFQEWKDEQPRHVREALARNWDAIVDAEEAADIFERFASAHGLKTKDEDGQSGAEGGKASSRRERQQSGSRAATVNGPAAAAGEPDDFDKAYEAAVAKRERERSRG